jgi:hypothetical protein
LQSRHSTSWPNLQFILLWLFWRSGISQAICPGLTSNHHPPNLHLPKS